MVRKAIISVAMLENAKEPRHVGPADAAFVSECPSSKFARRAARSRVKFPCRLHGGWGLHLLPLRIGPGSMLLLTVQKKNVN